MTPFYASPERQAAFVAEARSWARTPFCPNAAVKGPGGGVDCSRYLLALHEASGAVKGVVLETLPVEWVRDWHKHHAESRMVDFFNQPAVKARLKKVEDEEPRMIGDIVVCKVGLCEHHLATWIGAEVAHVQIPAGVTFTSVRDPHLSKLIRATYRIHE